MAADPQGSTEDSPPVDDQPPESDSRQDLERLRQILIGDERGRLTVLEERFDTRKLTAAEVAEVLPEAIFERAARDRQLGRALAPAIEEGITESVHRNPGPVAEAIYPTLGPAIRKAVSEAISSLVETINRTIEHSLSPRGLKWRFEALRAGVPYGEIILKRALVYRVEKVFLIHKETGLLLAHVAQDEQAGADADLVSAMLTAIGDFVADSFDASAEGGLRTFTVGERTVLVEAGPAAMLAATVIGQAPPGLLGRLQQTLEAVHLELHTALDDFDGDPEPFDAARPLLVDLLETVLETADPGTRSLAPRIAWGGIAVALVVLLTIGIRSSRRWQTAVATLDQEPGITILTSDRSWGGESITGLLDPLARDPQDLLSDMGFDPAGVEWSWTRIVSLDDDLVLRRAERRLAPPGAVQLVVNDGRLAAEGRATPRWIAAAGSLAATVAGVQAADFSSVVPAVAPRLEQTVDELEGRRVVFRLGSSSLIGRSQLTLDEAAQSLRRLLSLADEEAWSVALDLIGRTDGTGSETTNDLLSRRRAEVVYDALLQMGLLPDRVTTTGLGVSDPLSADDPDEQAQLNRSVSFTVRLELSTEIPAE